MAQEQAAPSGPDLTQGVTFADFVDGKLVGHVGDEEVLLVRSGSQLFAIGAHCTHYHGPLGDGLVVGATMPHLPSTGPICPRTISPARRRRIGCRCGRTTSMPRTESNCAATWKSPASIRRLANSSWLEAKTSPTTACCWRPVRSRCGFR